MCIITIININLYNNLKPATCQISPSQESVSVRHELNEERSKLKLIEKELVENEIIDPIHRRMSTAVTAIRSGVGLRRPRIYIGLHVYCLIVTSVPSVTNVFFMDCRDAYRFVRCGFVYVKVCYGAAFMYAAAQLCGRAYVVPRTRAAALS